MLQLSLDSVWTVIFGVPASKPVVVAREQVDLCPDAAMVILAMVRSMLNQVSPLCPMTRKASAVRSHAKGESCVLSSPLHLSP